VYNTFTFLKRHMRQYVKPFLSLEKRGVHIVGYCKHTQLLLREHTIGHRLASTLHSHHSLLLYNHHPISSIKDILRLFTSSSLSVSQYYTGFPIIHCINKNNESREQAINFIPSAALSIFDAQEHVSIHDRRGRMLFPRWGELQFYPEASD